MLVIELRKALKINIDNIQQEWKQAIDAKTPEGWLKVMMNTQAFDIAVQALNAAKTEAEIKRQQRIASQIRAVGEAISEY